MGDEKRYAAQLQAERDALKADLEYCQEECRRLLKLKDDMKSKQGDFRLLVRNLRQTRLTKKKRKS